MNSFAKSVLTWFDQHGRHDLPWQSPIEPYRVWLSEIMLQQTQVETVIPYFNKFVSTYKTVKALADADLDNVLHLWTGLGYYARARNLHKCAQIIRDDYNKQFPNEVESLAKLPGIGRSTAAAIASIAFDKPEAILDGNVKRVLARHFTVTGWPGNKKVENQLWQHAETLMPTIRCRDYTQAMMDLGATLCTRSKPQCLLCPVQHTCSAFAQGNPQDYPGKKPKKINPTKRRVFLIIKYNDQILLEQRPASGIWGGLWSFKEFDTIAQAEGYTSLQFQTHSSLTILDEVTHIFSHYKLIIEPVLLELQTQPKQINESNNTVWYTLLNPQKLGLAAPVKKLLNTLHNN